MEVEVLLRILKGIENGSQPPTLGHAINKLQFDIIASESAFNVGEWGYDEYVRYMETWKIKIIK